MGTVFWDAEGLILAEFLEPGQTITAARYVQTLHKLSRALHNKRPGRNIIILHDNAHPHAARLTSEAIAKMGWEVLPHPSYSPDLAPSDYHLFRFVKDQLRGQHYEKMEAIQKAVRQVSSVGWNGILQKGNFQTPRTLGEMCTKKWQLCGKIKKGL
jgi:transposase